MYNDLTSRPQSLVCFCLFLVWIYFPNLMLFQLHLLQGVVQVLSRLAEPGLEISCKDH